MRSRGTVSAHACVARGHCSGQTAISCTAAFEQLIHCTAAAFSWYVLNRKNKYSAGLSNQTNAEQIHAAEPLEEPVGGRLWHENGGTSTFASERLNGCLPCTECRHQHQRHPNQPHWQLLSLADRGAEAAPRPVLQRTVVPAQASVPELLRAAALQSGTETEGFLEATRSVGEGILPASCCRPLPGLAASGPGLFRRWQAVGCLLFPHILSP